MEYKSKETFNKNSSELGETSRKISNNRSIKKELENINILEEIKVKANELYIEFLSSSPKKIFRNISRDAIKFVFIFKTYYLMKIPVNPNDIVKRLGITHNSGKIIRKGISITFTDSDGLSNDVYFTALEMIPNYISKYNK